MSGWRITLERRNRIVLNVSGRLELKDKMRERKLIENNIGRDS